MRFILDALGLGGPKQYDGTQMPVPGKAVYKSPSGAEIPFDFEDVVSSVETKAAVFENAVGDGTYVQPNGRTGGRFPMSAIFHGAGFEARAEAFLSAVLEPGVGILIHPSYRQPIDVVPVGEITRSDAFKTGANQVIFSLSFYETTGLQLGAETGRNQLFDSLLDASAADFSDKTQLDDVVDKTSFKNKVLATIKTIETVMKNASQGLAGATELIESAGDSIDRGIDLLIGKPLALARQTQILIGEPRRQSDGARAKLDGYKNLTDSIFGLNNAEQSKYSNESINNFHLNKLVSQCIVGNYAMLAADGVDQYFKKSDYLLAADNVAALLDQYQEWHDNNYEALEVSTISEAATDTGDGISQLYDIVSQVNALLISASFNARTEMRAAVAGDQTPIDLCYDLYGTTKAEIMDLFLNTNDIVGDENFIIPKGREIVWYV